VPAMASSAGSAVAQRAQRAQRGIQFADRWDVVMLALAAAHAVLLLAAPTGPAIALGLWWNSNTISHNFIHRPFFRQRAPNRLFAAYLSVLLGFPHSLWRDRHLAHHGGVPARLHLSGELAVQAVLVLLLWMTLAARAPSFFLSVYLPGYAAGLILCALHGHYEHARGATSYYGRLYNVLCFNDGYHVEHHAHPHLHWTRLPECLADRGENPAVQASPWPAPLRWLEAFGLEACERLAFRSHALQRFMLRTHSRALLRLVRTLAHVDRVAIVGGGLFPRTALILQTLLPLARITIIDGSPANLDRARARLGGSTVEFVHAWYPQTDTGTYDLIVFPLSFHGRRGDIYARPPARAVVVHDWIWRKRGVSHIVSIVLLKRVNLVRP
jgi:fatty acid desaturase